jgi:hypothetical protein
VISPTSLVALEAEADQRQGRAAAMVEALPVTLATSQVKRAAMTRRTATYTSSRFRRSARSHRFRIATAS